jgi:hypothetical protein
MLGLCAKPSRAAAPALTGQFQSRHALLVFHFADAELAQGVSSPMMTPGWGAQKPVAPNTFPDGRGNPDGRQKNRRVEIVVKQG